MGLIFCVVDVAECATAMNVVCRVDARLGGWCMIKVIMRLTTDVVGVCCVVLGG